MPVYKTLEQISTNLQTALLHSRTDFLLQQAELWLEMNNAGGKSDAFVKPSNLDLAQSTFEFFMAPRSPNLLVRLFHSLFRIPPKPIRYHLCNKDELKSIKVIIEIGFQVDKQLKPLISTEPELTTKPDRTYVAGITS